MVFIHITSPLLNIPAGDAVARKRLLVARKLLAHVAGDAVRVAGLVALQAAGQGLIVGAYVDVFAARKALGHARVRVGVVRAAFFGFKYTAVRTSLTGGACTVLRVIPVITFTIS